MLIKVIFLAILILINGVFAATEIAFLSLNKYELHKNIKKGNQKAVKILNLINDSSTFLSTIQISITFSGFLASAFAAESFASELADIITISFLSYESLEKCLKLINVRYRGKTIACPFIGCSRFDGNGDKEKVLEIINNTLTDVDLVIYDYYQEKRNEKQIRVYKEEKEVKKKDYYAYYDMVKKRKAEAEKRFQKNGFARY